MRHSRPTPTRVEQSTRGDYSREFRIGLVIVSICLLSGANAQTEIHRCTDADGGIVFSQLPCKPLKTVESDKPEPDAESEGATLVSEEIDLLITETPQEGRESDADTLACKKQYRDAIDEIDAEMRREYSPDKADQYKQRLLLLTGKLRQC